MDKLNKALLAITVAENIHYGLAMVYAGAITYLIVRIWLLPASQSSLNRFSNIIRDYAPDWDQQWVFHFIMFLHFFIIIGIIAAIFCPLVVFFYETSYPPIRALSGGWIPDAVWKLDMVTGPIIEYQREVLVSSAKIFKSVEETNELWRLMQESGGPENFEAQQKLVEIYKRYDPNLGSDEVYYEIAKNVLRDVWENWS